MNTVNPRYRCQKDVGRRTSLACPHCSSALRVRSSRQVSPIVRQLSLACIDPECGATFGADVTITHAISPSARPDAAVQLRTAPPRRRPANDDVPARLDAPGGLEVPLPANDIGVDVATG